MSNQNSCCWLQQLFAFGTGAETCTLDGYFIDSIPYQDHTLNKNAETVDFLSEASHCDDYHGNESVNCLDPGVASRLSHIMGHLVNSSSGAGTSRSLSTTPLSGTFVGRKPFVGGNWKCNGNTTTIQALANGLNEILVGVGSEVDVVVSPPAVYIPLVLATLQIPDISVAVQNVNNKEGAFTGEVSPGMVLDLGVKWAIVGHSERRALFNETNSVVRDKLSASLLAGLSVIVCVGETLEQREGGQTHTVLAKQLRSIVEAVPYGGWHRVVLAYEPVWAIGTGKVATPEVAQQTHAFIRSWLSSASGPGPGIAALTRIIYGGSVKPPNCKELALQGDIDGFLVGGASLNAIDFGSITASLR